MKIRATKLTAIASAIQKLLGTFTPQSLFTSGVNGAWYDPSDITRYMSPLGPELVTNGDFYAGIIGWTPGNAGQSVLTWEAGKIRISRVNSGDTYPNARTPLTGLTVGRTYKIVSTTNNPFGIEAYHSIAGISASLVRTTAALRTIECVFTATATTHSLDVGIWSASGAVGQYVEFDNISVRELTGISTATLFQDAAGTTPVTAVGQPVGLMLDKSKGLVLGPELVTNGGFSSSSGWVLSTLGGSATISGGLLTLSGGSSAYPNATQSAVLTSGRWYKVVVVLTSTVTSGSLSLRLGGSTSQYTAFTNAGIYTLNVLSNGADLMLIRNSGFTDTITIDNISVRELPGNHAFNSSGNSANFPVLSARYNLLTKTEDFSDAVWTKSNAAVAANTAIAPDGTATADLLYPLTNGSDRRVIQLGIVLSTTSYTASAYIKAAGKTWAYMLVPQANSSSDVVWFNLATGDVGTKGSSATSASMQSVGGGWYRCVITGPGDSGSAFAINVADADNSTSVVTNGTDGIYIWGADLRPANDALNQPAYQRVNTATDYDTVGFKPYLSFNGVNQWLQTNSIDFTYGDKMFVSAGVRKLSDATIGSVVSISTAPVSSTGTFEIYTPGTNGGDTHIWYSRGTATAGASGPYAAPITNVLSGIGDISGNKSILRVNGTQVSSSNYSQGAVNYGNHQLFIGARAGSGFFFNGRLYGLVVAGKQASASEIASTEAWLNSKTGAYEGTPGTMSLDINFTDNTYYSRVI